MELCYVEKIEGCGYDRQILGLLEQADGEFIPPLSSRGSTTQQNLSSTQAVSAGVLDYYDTMAQQPAILAIENGRCLGFMAFKIDYDCPQTPGFPNLYASTCVVSPQARGKGLMQGFYEKMMAVFPNHSIFTRTWHTNFAHLRVLEKLGFTLTHRLPEHRGPNLDTVYYTKFPTI